MQQTALDRRPSATRTQAEREADTGKRRQGRTAIVVGGAAANRTSAEPPIGAGIGTGGMYSTHTQQGNTTRGKDDSGIACQEQTPLARRVKMAAAGSRTAWTHLRSGPRQSWTSCCAFDASAGFWTWSVLARATYAYDDRGMQTANGSCAVAHGRLPPAYAPYRDPCPCRRHGGQQAAWPRSHLAHCHHHASKQAALRLWAHTFHGKQHKSRINARDSTTTRGAVGSSGEKDVPRPRPAIMWANRGSGQKKGLGLRQPARSPFQRIRWCAPPWQENHRSPRPEAHLKVCNWALSAAVGPWQAVADAVPRC